MNQLGRSTDTSTFLAWAEPQNHRIDYARKKTGSHKEGIDPPAILNE